MRFPSGPSFLNSWSFWRLNLLGWGAFAVIGFIIRYSVHRDPIRALGFTLLQEPMAFVFSGLLYLFYRRPSLRDPFGIFTAAWVIGLSLIAAMTHAAVACGLISVTGWNKPNWDPEEEWLLRVIFVWLVYMGWSLCVFGAIAKREAWSEKERARKAKDAAQRIELQLLRAQLDPHFLFNSLNGIAAEVQPHPDAALEMVRELSDYLRYSLDQRHSVVTPLGAELNAVSAYLKIEQARFGEQLRSRVDADAAARACLVPSFLLQPLVENAVKHGLRGGERPWDLVISASRTDSTLHIEVRNSGHLSAATAKHEGVGLETLRRRLELHYPRRHRFKLSEKNGAVVAELNLEGDACFA